MQHKTIHPYFHSGWIKFNCEKWNLKPISLHLPGNNAETSVEALFYFNKKNQIIIPPLHTYSSIHFNTGPLFNQEKTYRQYLDLSNLLMEQVNRYAIKEFIILPPEIYDIRPWQWNSYLTNIRYTFQVQLPLSIDSVHASVRKNINKAEREGFRIIRSYDYFDGIIDCLNDTKRRQKFDVNLTKTDLQNLMKYTDQNFFRVYVALDKNDQLIAFRIVLATEGEMAIDWLAGTNAESLNSGITQGLIKFIFDDLNDFGIKSFDFAGAGIPSVALSKSHWGGKLVPYYTINRFSLSWIIRFLRFRIKQDKHIPVSF